MPPGDSPTPELHGAFAQPIEGMLSVLNVGAGTGSYEPPDLPVVAVEPSWQMIGQRTNGSNVVQARAERLPFTDRSFAAAMAVLTVSHWADTKRGLEMGQGCACGLRGLAGAFVPRLALHACREQISGCYAVLRSVNRGSYPQRLDSRRDLLVQ
jgi:Methyltransferase domain